MPRKIRANQKVYEYFRENSEVLSGKYVEIMQMHYGNKTI